MLDVHSYVSSPYCLLRYFLWSVIVEHAHERQPETDADLFHKVSESSRLTKRSIQLLLGESVTSPKYIWFSYLQVVQVSSMTPGEAVYQTKRHRPRYIGSKIRHKCDNECIRPDQCRWCVALIFYLLRHPSSLTMSTAPMSLFVTPRWTRNVP